VQDLPSQELPDVEQAHEASRMRDDTSKKGVKTKLFGVGLIFLGALDSMLFWRGGLVVNDFYLLLFVLGCIIYIIGAIRASGTQTDLKR
jgi:hypothetical protein